MKSQLAAVILMAVVVGSAWGQDNEQKQSRSWSSAQRASTHSVYLCVDKKGNKEYRNTGITKGCKKIALPGLTTVPAPQRRQVAATTAKKASTPAGFPKVDGATQKSRDSDRKQILFDEQKTEEQKLANLKREYNNGDPERRGDERNYAKYQERVGKMKEDIERTEKNIEALKREIGNLK